MMNILVLCSLVQMKMKKTSKYNLSDGEEDDLDISGGHRDDFDDEVERGSDEEDEAQLGST